MSNNNSKYYSLQLQKVEFHQGSKNFFLFAVSSAVYDILAEIIDN